jgi:hypothetical protein
MLAGITCSTLYASSSDTIALHDSLAGRIENAGSTGKVWNPAITGALSAALPGAGQIYTGHYIKAGGFLALEAVSGGMARFWYRTWQERREQGDFQRKISILATNRRDSLNSLEVAELMHFDALVARNTMYDALSWMIGGYVFNVLDAIGSSRYFINDEKKDPIKAAWLAAIPALGLGQLYNGSFSKAGMVLMTQTSLGIIAINEHRLMKASQVRLLIAKSIKDSTGSALITDRNIGDWESRQNTAFRNRNSYLWYSIFFYVYGILDAVVDAHLHDYNQKIRAWPDLMPQNGGAVRLNVDYRF